MARATLFLFLFVAALWALSVNASPAGFTDKDLQSEESLRLLYHKWVLQHGSTRNTSDERFKIFVENVKYIDSVNKKNLTYHLGLNQFSDMTEQEFASAMGCVSNYGLFSGDMSRVKNGSFSGDMSRVKNASFVSVPGAVDWVARGAVTRVRHQGSCGCCWAFATAATIEGLYQIQNGRLLTLSTQQLLDCTGRGNDCNGGNLRDGFNYVRQRRNYGITEEVYYRYEGVKQPCDDAVVPRGATIRGFKRVYGEPALRLQVAKGPVGVAVMFHTREIQNYRGGVFIGRCSREFDHTVAVVGYGQTGGNGCSRCLKYWKIKNSWGNTWGEQGYIRLLRGTASEGLCGIGQKATYPY